MTYSRINIRIFRSYPHRVQFHVICTKRLHTHRPPPRLPILLHAGLRIHGRYNCAGVLKWADEYIYIQRMFGKPRSISRCELEVVGKARCCVGNMPSIYDIIYIYMYTLFRQDSPFLSPLLFLILAYNFCLLWHTILFLHFVCKTSVCLSQRFLIFWSEFIYKGIEKQLAELLCF